MSGAWSCPHDYNGICQRVQGAYCDPGMRGCELEGKVRFANPEQNAPRKPVKASTEPEHNKPSGTTQKAPPRRRLPF